MAGAHILNRLYSDCGPALSLLGNALVPFAPAVILAAALLVLVLWYIPAYFASYEILFPKGAIIINRGIFIRTTHIMPFSRLIYVQSYSTPLAHSMGLAALSLKAARSSVIIPELPVSDVELFIKSVTREENA